MSAVLNPRHRTEADARLGCGLAQRLPPAPFPYQPAQLSEIETFDLGLAADLGYVPARFRHLPMVAPR